ncbi:metal-sensitive transcriptional regulator [Arthrobacter sp. TMP15]|uniref:metal-sensitive transcriptional regulator n=1 Tax=Arthrobacter sp. TMP15 TaxID=3140789 RepID=UPI0031BB4B8A
MPCPGRSLGNGPREGYPPLCGGRDRKYHHQESAMSTTAQTPPAAALGLAHAPVQSAGQRKNRSVLGRPAQGGCSPGRILVPAVAAGTEQRRTVNRLRKAHGQLGAVIAAMQSGAGCPVLIPQLSAVRAALD